MKRILFLSSLLIILTGCSNKTNNDSNNNDNPNSNVQIPTLICNLDMSDIYNVGSTGTINLEVTLNYNKDKTDIIDGSARYVVVYNNDIFDYEYAYRLEKELKEGFEEEGLKNIESSSDDYGIIVKGILRTDELEDNLDVSGISKTNTLDENKKLFEAAKYKCN